MSVHYDDLDINRDIRFDIPLREGVGIVRTHDVTHHHPLVTLVSSPAWTILDSNLGCLTLDGAADHLTSSGVDTALMDFTSADYSIGGWYLNLTGDPSQELINRYLLNNNGWELYHYSNGIMTLRHHHAATLVGGNPRSAIYSTGWAYNTWYFMGITRSAGEDAIFYRGDANGFGLIPTISSAGGLHDAESCNQNLYIGCRGAASNWHTGMFWRYRAWARALTQSDWQSIFERELRWFLS